MPDSSRAADKPELITITSAQVRFASWMTDVLVYIVVLNLWVEFAGAVIIDSFWISILTAVLLKGMLDLIIGVEHQVNEFFKAKGTTTMRIIGLLCTWAILFLSKFLILEVVDVVFGDHVSLGHFIEVVGIVISMMVARGLFRYGYKRLGVVADA